MKVAIVGCGNQGVGIGAQLVSEVDVESVLMLDYSAEAAARAAVQVSSRPNASGKVVSGTVNALDPEEVASKIKGFDVMVNATLPELNMPLMRSCIIAGVHYLDLYAHPDGVPYAEESATLGAQLRLYSSFSEAGLLAIPSVGVNPGWVNLAAAASIEAFDEVERITIRELEWLDSDELLVSGPPALFLELFLGGPGALRMRSGEVEMIDLVRSEDVYDFPAPVGRQGVLSTNGNGTALLIAAESPIPIGCIEEKFAVLSGGLSMKDVLLTSVARQTAEHESAENLFELFGKSLIPTSSIDISEWHRDGRLRDAAWVSSVEVVGVKSGQRFRTTVDCSATLKDAQARLPWAPPGVVVTSAMPAELVLRIGRKQIRERGVVPVFKLACSSELLTDIQRHGVTVNQRAESL